MSIELYAIFSNKRQNNNVEKSTHNLTKENKSVKTFLICVNFKKYIIPYQIPL